MQYSKLFGKTIKEAPADATAVSHRLLHQAGFIRESTAGRYFFLPLGMKVQQKIMHIIKEAMDQSGAQEMVSPVLHPLELWEETNRTNTAGFELMRITDRRGANFALGGTAEEMFVDVVRKFQISYKELPINIYQFSSKFRDEMRARGGLLRVREFVMKDAYSFDQNEDCFKKTYKVMELAYTQIFDRLGLKTVVVESDGGYIGGEYCHEFIVDSEAGESEYLTTKTGTYAAHVDVAKFFREVVNANDEMKPMEIVKQPEWVKTMEDNEKHYKLPASRFLKNVVYKNRVTKEIIIAVLRGDLEVNKAKLERVTTAIGMLEEATDDDLESIGTKRGYVHSWGHTGARYIGDLSLSTVKNFIGGQKEETTDSINVNFGRDFQTEVVADIALAHAGYRTVDGSEELVAKKGIEVGNIFQLGYHYTSKMKNATFVDDAGEEKQYYMGCYGIGVGRTLATLVEFSNDEKGIVWTKASTPYEVHLIGLNLNEPDQKNRAQELYHTLLKSGVDVLYDDREEATAGVKFADADLIGIPIRLVISKKTGAQVEWKERTQSQSQMLTVEDVIKKIKEFYA